MARLPRIYSETEMARWPASRLGAYRAAWDAEENAACGALIAAGRGHEKGGQTREAAKAGDPLAARWATARDAAMAAWSEIQTRRRWHGSDKPIKRPAWLSA